MAMMLVLLLAASAAAAAAAESDGCLELDNLDNQGEMHLKVNVIRSMVG